MSGNLKANCSIMTGLKVSFGSVKNNAFASVEVVSLKKLVSNMAIISIYWYVSGIPKKK